MQEGNRIIGTEITEWPWGLMRHSGFNCAIHSAVSGSNLKQTIYPFSEFNGFIRSRLLEICLLNFSLSLENEKKIKRNLAKIKKTGLSNMASHRFHYP